MKYALALRIAEGLVDELSCACIRIEIKGSLARQKDEVGDVELVAIPKYEETGQGDLFGGPVEKLNLLHAKITRLGPDRILPIKPGTNRNVEGTWVPDDKWSAKSVNDSRYFRLWMTRKEIRADLFMATPETWGVVATIRTGSAGFSQKLVTKWTKASGGGHFNAGRIHLPWKIGETVVARTSNGVPLGSALDTPEERDVFKALGMEWAEPCDRV